MVFAVRNYGIVREELTYGNRAAWLRTARIRMSTVEPKQFKYARIRTNPGVGSLTVQAETDTTGAQEIYSIDLPDEAERFSLPPGKAEWLALTFTLTDQAVMTSYQVLSLPAQARQRVFSLPVSLFDHEVNRHEKRIGYPVSSSGWTGWRTASVSATTTSFSSASTFWRRSHRPRPRTRSD
jgi:hypothetical protein